jgi:hypothetical protein
MVDISPFLQVYANLPKKLREQIVVVIDGQPMTWNAVYVEVEAGTQLGERIIIQLMAMEII